MSITPLVETFTLRSIGEDAEPGGNWPHQLRASQTIRHAPEITNLGDWIGETSYTPDDNRANCMKTGLNSCESQRRDRDDRTVAINRSLDRRVSTAQNQP